MAAFRNSVGITAQPSGVDQPRQLPASNANRENRNYNYLVNEEHFSGAGGGLDRANYPWLWCLAAGIQDANRLELPIEVYANSINAKVTDCTLNIHNRMTLSRQKDLAEKLKADSQNFTTVCHIDKLPLVTRKLCLIILVNKLLMNRAYKLCPLMERRRLPSVSEELVTIYSLWFGLSLARQMMLELGLLETKHKNGKHHACSMWMTDQELDKVDIALENLLWFIKISPKERILYIRAWTCYTIHSMDKDAEIPWFIGPKSNFMLNDPWAAFKDKKLSISKRFAHVAPNLSFMGQSKTYIDNLVEAFFPWAKVGTYEKKKWVGVHHLKLSCPLNLVVHSILTKSNLFCTHQSSDSFADFCKKDVAISDFPLTRFLSKYQNSLVTPDFKTFFASRSLNKRPTPAGFTLGDAFRKKNQKSLPKAPKSRSLTKQVAVHSRSDLDCQYEGMSKEELEKLMKPPLIDDLHMENVPLNMLQNGQLEENETQPPFEDDSNLEPYHELRQQPLKNPTHGILPQEPYNDDYLPFDEPFIRYPEPYNINQHCLGFGGLGLGQYNDPPLYQQQQPLDATTRFQQQSSFSIWQNPPLSNFPSSSQSQQSSNGANGSSQPRSDATVHQQLNSESVMHKKSFKQFVSQNPFNDVASPNPFDDVMSSNPYYDAKLRKKPNKVVPVPHQQYKDAVLHQKSNKNGANNQQSYKDAFLYQQQNNAEVQQHQPYKDAILRQQPNNNASVRQQPNNGESQKAQGAMGLQTASAHSSSTQQYQTSGSSDQAVDLASLKLRSVQLLYHGTKWDAERKYNGKILDRIDRVWTQYQGDRYYQEPAVKGQPPSSSNRQEQSFDAKLYVGNIERILSQPHVNKIIQEYIKQEPLKSFSLKNNRDGAKSRP